MDETNGSSQMLEAYRRKGTMLAEKWSNMPGRMLRYYGRDKNVDFLKGLDDDNKRALVAHMFENTYNWLNNMEESTRTINVGSFEKYVFPVIRAMMANLVATELVSVQPLDAPIGLVFYMDVLFGTTKGNIKKGDRMYDARRGPARSFHYSDETVEEEYVGVGNTGSAPTLANLSYLPARPGTVKLIFTDGDGTARTIYDDGNGVLLISGNGNGTITGATVNYSTGAIAFTPSSFTIGTTTQILANYEYNSEGNAGVPEVDIQLTSSPIVARPNKLRSRWSIEAQQDLQSYHGINAEVDLISFMANEISKELNYKIIRHLFDIAAGGSVTWDRTPPSAVPWLYHKETLYDAFVNLSNQIYNATQRWGGSWVVVGLNVATIIETLARFESSGPSTGNVGVTKIGRLGQFDIYKDPTLSNADSFLMGYKGGSFLEAGYLYCPYLQLYTTPSITLDDMMVRKGMACRTGTKVVNALMYATGTISDVATGSGSTSVFPPSGT